ncbi:MAG: hypothetical protein ACKPB8_11385, partial [Alphaproteobacteria bacterium]
FSPASAMPKHFSRLPATFPDACQPEKAALACAEGEISLIFTSISSLGQAVEHITHVIEQQGDATNSIVQKVQFLAQATNGTAEKMRNVRDDAKSGGAAADQVLEASASVAMEARELEARITHFVEEKQRLEAA